MRAFEAEERVHDASGIESEGALLEHHEHVGDLVALAGVANAQVCEGNADGRGRAQTINVGA
jgi:hypothetical protein